MVKMNVSPLTNVIIKHFTGMKKQSRKLQYCGDGVQCLRVSQYVPDAGLARHSLDAYDGEVDGPRLEAHLEDFGGERGRIQVAGCHVGDPGVLLIQANLRSKKYMVSKVSKVQKNSSKLNELKNDLVGTLGPTGS